jgi:SAM-dependent methyltransferase
MTTTSTYVFDNAAPETATRFAGLERALDPLTTRILAALPVGTGAQCLEIGAGGGSVARWLSQRVGASGSVLATDINLDWFDGAGPNVEAKVHDIVSEPLPAGAFDLVHARLVLVHLRERAAILDRIVGSLRPGGWVVLEEFDRALPTCAHAPSEREELVNRVGDAVLDFLAVHGADTTYPRQLPWRLRAAGLTEVGAAGHVDYATGGSAAAQVLRANIDQVGDAMATAGLVTREDIAAYRDTVDDPELILNLPLFVSAWGRRP